MKKKKDDAHNITRARVFENIGTISQSIASPIRLRILQSLANAPSTVEGLSLKTGESIANTSQHLQKMLKANLLHCEKKGVSRIYSLANDDVLEVWLSLQKLASSINPQVQQDEQELSPPDLISNLNIDEILELVESNKAILLDARDAEDISGSTVPGAISVSLNQLQKQISTLPKKKKIFVFCRGRYCTLANPIVEALRSKGYDSYRLKSMAPELKKRIFKLKSK